MEIKITIPKEEEQRVLDAYNVDNEADLKTEIIRSIKDRVDSIEKSKATLAIQDSVIEIVIM